MRPLTIATFAVDNDSIHVDPMLRLAEPLIRPADYRALVQSDDFNILDDRAETLRADVI